MFLFVCWTPYQILNAVNFVINNIENSKNNADIYIYHEFRNSQEISDALKKANVFSHVYDVEVYDKKRVWYSKFNKIKRLLTPYSTLKKYLKSDIDVRRQGYETLIISGNNLFSVNLFNSIKNLKVYFIDDGLGSYFGDMRANDMTLIYRVFNKLFHRGPLSYKPEKMYVNNKAVCQTKICDKIIQLPAIRNNEKTLETLKYIYSYKCNKLYSEKKYIYLTQPLEENIKDNQKTVDKTISSAIGSKVLVRVHPLQNAEDYSEYSVDMQKNFWELDCADSITDSHVLISAFSTAQFTPKILFDSEPTVIFTYKLYSEKFIGVDSTVRMFKELYRNPERIIVVDSLSELEQILFSSECN